jgi:drug/metabolite transporter (DMT)-like permease
VRVPPAPTPARARLLIALAACLWSLSGAFTKVLYARTPLGLDEPQLAPLQLAFFRAFFAGLVLAPTLRRADVTWRPAMLGMVATFATMSASFIAAMALGTAANAIWLQYTAPLWVYLAGQLWFGERPERRGTIAVLLGTAGVVVIVAGNWDGGQLGVVALALLAGVTFAGVLIWLRVLSGEAPNWLTLLNHLGSALVLVPVVWAYPLPTTGQIAWIFLFGAVQMALPYVLVSRALRSISPQEAGTLTLIEPLLNPVWAYLLAPETETPSAATVVGAAVIGAALLVRYWPSGRPSPP